MSRTCEKFGASTCTVEDAFCSKRHKKALDNPQDFSLEPCRLCEEGKRTWESLRIEASNGFGAYEVQGLRISTHPSGICTSCREAGIRDHNLKGRAKKEKSIMGTVAEKVCIDCSQKYKSTSNAQKRCEECGEKHKKAINQQRYKKSQVSYGPRRPKNKTGVKPVMTDQGANSGTLQGKITKPEKVSVTADAALGQLLFVSDMLDGQIDTALENGTVDTSILIDIRKRIGVVLRASLPVSEVAAA